LLTGSAYTDTTAPSPATSYYRVTAVDTAGQESSPTAASGTRRIAFRAASTGKSKGGTTLSVTKPTGLQAGDVMVAVVDVMGTAAITAPAGWTLIRDTANGTTMHQSAYWKVAGTSEPRSYAWTLSSAQLAAVAIAAYRGVATVSPVDVNSGGIATSASISAPSVTTTSGAELIVGLYGIATQATVTPPTGMLEQAEIAASSGKAKADTEISDDIQEQAGATGDRTATASRGGANIGQLVVLRQAP